MSFSDKENLNKFSLVLLDSKRSLSFSKAEELCADLARYGYYFDKVCRIAYDDSDEIVRIFTASKTNGENMIVLCPQSMDGAVKNFLSTLYDAQFNAIGVLNTNSQIVAVLYTDSTNRLTVEDIKNLIVEQGGERYDKIYIKFVGAPKDLIARTLSKARSIYESGGAARIFFNLTEDYDDFRLEIVYSERAPKMLIDAVQRCIVGGFNDYVYALEDISLAEQLFRLLQLRRLKISVAESFTGGGVGKKLVEVPGVSQVFVEGLNTYSNSSKQYRLNVAELTLIQCGAVSAETAYQMAEGLLKTESCDVAISTTGIAGPKSDNTSKPIGLAYIAVGVGEDISVYQFNFTGDRERITNCAINRALFLAYKRLK